MFSSAILVSFFAVGQAVDDDICSGDLFRWDTVKETECKIGDAGQRTPILDKCPKKCEMFLKLTKVLGDRRQGGLYTNHEREALQEGRMLKNGNAEISDQKNQFWLPLKVGNSDEALIEVGGKWKLLEEAVAEEKRGGCPKDYIRKEGHVETKTEVIKIKTRGDQTECSAKCTQDRKKCFSFEWNEAEGECQLNKKVETFGGAKDGWFLCVKVASSP
jgi:hypothetical protein